MYYKYSNMSSDTNIAIQSPVTFTAGAITEINRLMAEPDFDQQQRLRVGVKGGGCSGMTYVLGFDVPKADDEILSTNELIELIATSTNRKARIFPIPKKLINTITIEKKACN